VPLPSLTRDSGARGLETCWVEVGGEMYLDTGRVSVGGSHAHMTLRRRMLVPTNGWDASSWCPSHRRRRAARS
jgi:hypothetical protein